MFKKDQLAVYCEKNLMVDLGKRRPEILEENPELAEKLAEGFANSNVDMNRYIIGDENNSLNPMTGQPEFFLKKLVSGIKSFVKGAVNVVKKIAPVVLPFAINMIAPGLGSIASGALGAGLGSLIQGKSFKDSMKASSTDTLKPGQPAYRSKTWAAGHLSRIIA